MGVGAARSTKGLLPFSFNGVRAMAAADLLEPCKTMPTKALSSVAHSKRSNAKFVSKHENKFNVILMP